MHLDAWQGMQKSRRDLKLALSIWELACNWGYAMSGNHSRRLPACGKHEHVCMVTDDAALVQVLPDYNNVPVSQVLSEYIQTGKAYAQVRTASIC